MYCRITSTTDFAATTPLSKIYIPNLISVTLTIMANDVFVNAYQDYYLLNAVNLLKRFFHLQYEFRLQLTCFPLNIPPLMNRLA
jgi:hypothetical protein